MAAEFFQRNIIVIYFLYGLAFFSMGLAIWLESARFRTSEFRLAYALWPLAGFGLVHGLHEWFEMFDHIDNAGVTNIPPWLLLEEVRIAHLVVSFLLLLVFGIVLLYVNRRQDGREGAIAALGVGLFLAIWVGSILATWLVYQPGHDQMVAAAHVLTRYTLGIPAAILAAWAIWLEQSAFRSRGMPAFGRALLGAAIALLIYGVIGQIFGETSFLFPSNVINNDLFIRVFGFPVQVLRAGMAALMALFIIKALNAFEVENRQRLQSAIDARLAAQQEAMRVQQQAQAQTEKLNRDLQAAVQDLSLLFYLSRRQASTLDRRALLEQSVPVLVSAVPRMRAGMVLLREGPDERLEVVSIVECDDPRAEIAERREQGIRLAEYTLETAAPAWMIGQEIIPLDEPASIDHLPLAAAGTAFEAGHTVAMPLSIQGEVIGALVACTIYDAPPFTSRDVSLLRAIADQLSIALENATLYEQVEQHSKVRGELLHRVVSAQEAERQRIARELHDGTGQTLTALGLGLAAAADRLETQPVQTRQQLLDMKQMNAHALQELHDVIADLRPSILDNLGLVAALRGQTSGFESRTGISTQLMVQGKATRLRPDVETTVFRVCQEALTNVMRHAEARSVVVQLVFSPDEVVLSVEDDGRGFEPQAALARGTNGRTAWGLLGIEERAALVGGMSEISSRPGEGTAVRVTVPNPYPEENHG